MVGVKVRKRNFYSSYIFTTLMSSLSSEDASTTVRHPGLRHKLVTIVDSFDEGRHGHGRFAVKQEKGQQV